MRKKQIQKGSLSQEQTSFLNLLNQSKTPSIRIIIPNIQRDYVQGRDDKVSVRNPFLSAIKESLEEEKPLHLDLIYGYIRNDSEFIPLDGQQRLTTLFLLHWYLANQSGKLAEFQRILWDKDNDQARFVYQTRPSATTFCKALCSERVNLKLDGKGISDQVRDCSFFRDYWSSDPTVKAILSMLDAIHSNFKSTSGLYDKIVTNDKSMPLLTFDCLDIDYLDSSDLLYIRMNDRGLPLSSFDEFKASIEQYLTVNKSTEYDFSKKVDGDWTDMVWSSIYRNDDSFSSTLYDLAFSHLFFAHIITGLCLVKKEQDVEKLFDQFLDAVKINSSISFFQYTEYELFKPDDDESTKIVEAIVEGMDTLVSLWPHADTQLTPRNLNIRSLVNSIEDFKDHGEQTRKYSERVLLYGLLRYYHKTDSSTELDNSFKTWARILQNIVDATEYNNPQEFIKSIKTIDKMFTELGNESVEQVLLPDNLANLTSGFDSVQVEEEILKLALIKDELQWEEEIEKAEQVLPYFKGQIGFLLLVAGVDVDHWTFGDPLNIDETVIGAFSQAKKSTRKLFGEDGLPEDPSFTMERVLLTLGEYPVNFGGRNFYFLNNSHRDYSWKRFFKCQKDQVSWEKRRELIIGLYKLIEEIKGVDNLRDYITQYDNDQIGWKNELVRCPKLFQYYSDRISNGRCMQEGTPHGRVFLSKTYLSSLHAEFYSYLFYKMFENYEDYGIFKENKDEKYKLEYYEVGGISDPSDFPCTYLEGWERQNHRYGLDVLYRDDMYQVRLFQRNGNGDIQNDIKQIVENSSLQLIQFPSDNPSDNEYWFECKSKNDVIPVIHELSSLLKPLLGRSSV